MTNHKTSSFSPLSVFAVLLVLALAYNFTGCTDPQKSPAISNKPNKAGIDLNRKVQKPKSGRSEDLFLYRQLMALGFAHHMLTESFMFFVREVPDCQDKPAHQRTQDRQVAFDQTLVKELSLLIRSHWDVSKEQYLLERSQPGQKTKFVFVKEASGRIRELNVLRTVSGREQTVARMSVVTPTKTRWEFNHQAYHSSYEVALGLGQRMSCEVENDTTLRTLKLQCQNLGHAKRVGRNLETIIMPMMEYQRNGDPILSGSGAQYRNHRALCVEDKPISFVAPRNQGYATLFVHHDRAAQQEAQPAKPPIAGSQTPEAASPPAAAPESTTDQSKTPESTADKSAADKSATPELTPPSVGGVPVSEFVETALGNLAPSSPGSEILKSEGALESLKVEAIHGGQAEPASGAPIFQDPNDLNGVNAN